MNLHVECPHCKAIVSIPVNVQVPCPNCAQAIITEVHQQGPAQASPPEVPKLGCCAGMLLALIFSVAMAVVPTWFGSGKKAPEPVSYPSYHTLDAAGSYNSPPSTDVYWLNVGREAYARLQKEGKTIRMATVNGKGSGMSCALVLVKGTWQTLSSADQNGLASLLHDYAQGKPWRLFDGGEVMRSNGSW